jgi:hypothetical protein
LLPVEEIWVNVEEGARRTGYHLDHVRRLARENWRLPENERYIRIRKDGHAYAIWLPDLIHYFEGNNAARVTSPDEEIWVSVREAADMIGYTRSYVTKIAVTMLEKTEAEREIQVRKRSFGYELWLPDLLVHTTKKGIGPQGKRKPVA